MFPWLLIANPADAFRLINMPADTVSTLATGLGAAGNTSGFTMQLGALLIWPVLALGFAWMAFRRIEP